MEITCSEDSVVFTSDIAFGEQRAVVPSELLAVGYRASAVELQVVSVVAVFVKTENQEVADSGLRVACPG